MPTTILEGKTIEHWRLVFAAQAEEEKTVLQKMLRWITSRLRSIAWRAPQEDALPRQKTDEVQESLFQQNVEDLAIAPDHS
ncbi:MAG: hypothetical protein O3A92_10380 [Verrucomicrobia bacterium]|nr:hypothetical protein [Verrucomicrobiota bacterium]